MRILAVVVAGLLALSGASGLAGAAETGPSVGGQQPVPGVEKSKASRIDELFATLKATTSKDAAKAAETDILRLWLQSDSDTVDLLMTWAMKAMEEKNYALALDFLDRVVTMKPDYVEGWNKRATVFYLTDEYSKSISDIGRTLEIEPRHFGALAGLGMIMHDIGDDKRAIDAYNRALSVDPFLDNVQKSLDEIEAKAAGKEI